ncbi:hypothetical protein Tco_1521301, partial [Tanacetum coccineum]
MGGSSIPETESGTLSATPNHSSNDDFYDSQSVDSTTAGDVYVPRWSSNAGFLNSFNINSAQHTSMVSELRLRFEHEIMSREKFEKKFSESAAIVQQRDTEIADLKAKLGKAESEAVTLRQHVTELETAAAAVVALNERNVELSWKVSALESVRGELDGKISDLTANCNSLQGKVAGEMKMREEFKSVQDAAARRLDERVAEMKGRIADVKRDMNDHLYPHMFTAIARRLWVIGHGLRLAVYKCAPSVECAQHGKEGRSLAQIEAYDPEIEAKFVVVVSEFKNISFPLLDELEGLRDSPLAPIMSALTLKDDHEVVPSVVRSAERRGLCPPSNPAPSTSIGISNYQFSTLAQPHDDLFDAGVLDKPVDACLTVVEPILTMVLPVVDEICEASLLYLD